MTRGVKHAIRAVGLAVICANAAILYTARPAQGAVTCPTVVTTCSSPGTCSLPPADWVPICQAACQTAGGSTCNQRSGFPIQCEPVGVSCNGDAELFCHCAT